MKNVFLTLFVFLSIVSCKKSVSSEASFFDKDGVSFEYSQGWTITDQEDVEQGLGYYLSLEKDGFNSSGLVTVSWVNGEINLDDYIYIFQEELRKNPVYVNSDVIFKDIYDAKFNEIDSRKTEFNLTLLGGKFQGEYNVFHSNGKTIAVLRQGAVEDIQKNSPGFEKVENTFKVL